MHKIILAMFSILKIWAIGFAIIFPVAISLCKAAKRGDEVNELVNTRDDEKK